MKICTSCVLPDTFPGIYFDENGQGFYCPHYKKRAAQEDFKVRFQQKFSHLRGTTIFISGQ